MSCPPPHRVEEMVERFVRYRNQGDMYDCAAVTVRGMSANVQRERDGLRNDLAEKREATAQTVRNEGAARAREAEVAAARDNSRTELTQVRNCLNRFRERLSSGMHALLNIFNSIVGQGGQFGSVSANRRL